VNKNDVRLGKYLIGDRIGAGGMGVVYRAFDTVLQRWVALKTILADKASDREFLSRFRREALAVSQIDHPNIVRLFDFVEGDPAKGEPSYMVMEFLPGEDLGKLIRKGPLDVSRAVDIILEACAAVGTCHRRGFVHRDLKPTNIFVAEYDRIETAKVLDFGAAKSWGDRGEGESELSELTRKGTAVGTPEYLAPEILQGKAATPKADQYALGVVLYTALAGKKPFAVDKNAEFKEFQLWQAVAKGDHPRLSAQRSDIPDGLDEVVERAMHTDAARRLPDIHEFGAALLPWASAPARLRWTAHFTSAPGLTVAAGRTTSEATNDRTLPPPLTGSTAATESTIREPGAAQADTRPVGSGELRLAAAAAPLTEVTSGALREVGSRSPSESIPIAVDVTAHYPSDGAPVSSAAVESSQPKAAASRVSALVHRPRVLLGASAVLLGLALTGAFLLSRARDVATSHPTVPDDIFRPKAQRAAEPPVRTDPPPTTISPAPAGTRIAAPTAATARSAAADGRRPVRRRHKAPEVDRKGVPIPSD
jgi:eukaryotic-like serine/threonine-protein kinase